MNSLTQDPYQIDFQSESYRPWDEFDRVCTAAGLTYQQQELLGSDLMDAVIAEYEDMIKRRAERTR